MDANPHYGQLADSHIGPDTRKPKGYRVIGNEWWVAVRTEEMAIRVQALALQHGYRAFIVRDYRSYR
jgi:hypothetical protein